MGQKHGICGIFWWNIGYFFTIDEYRTWLKDQQWLVRTISQLASSMICPGTVKWMAGFPVLSNLYIYWMVAISYQLSTDECIWQKILGWWSWAMGLPYFTWCLFAGGLLIRGYYWLGEKRFNHWDIVVEATHIKLKRIETITGWWFGTWILWLSIYWE